MFIFEEIGNVVMTPKRNGKTLSMMVVRKETVDPSSTFFQADGKHKGLFVNQEGAETLSDANPDMDLDFRCFLINQKTQERTVVSWWLWQDVGDDQEKFLIF